MIIVRTPTRVSFCGGGSDLPAFYEKHGGAVISSGISRYVYLSIHPNFYPEKLKCKYSKNEEVDILKEPIGKQDQYAAAFGGLNLYNFHRDGNVTIEPIIMSAESMKRLEHNLLMFYTGDVRSASAILSEQRKNISTDAEKEQAQLKILNYTYELQKELINNNIDDKPKRY